MVRLKAPAAVDKYIKERTFQFHNGSIKSGKQQYVLCSQGKVSIPQWFD